MSERGRVVIIGAGISGLSTAFWLHRSGVDVTVLERQPWVGGTMRTLHENGWLIETGPNSALETTPLFGQMFDALGITDARLYPDPASDRRYILRGGTLHVLPMSPGAFLWSSLWSLKGKLRLLKEPFVCRATTEESIAEFVERRLGREFLDYAINPFVAGVYAGSPEQLSVRAAFPKLYALEEKYGGLVKGLIKGAKERKQRAEKAKDRARMFSFVDGMQTFPDAIGKMLGEHIILNSTVTSIERSAKRRGNSGQGPDMFSVAYTRDGRPFTIDADAVILAVPSYVASKVVQLIARSVASVLEHIYYPPVAEVFLGFAAQQITKPLDGFGYLIPTKERRAILGTIWSSTLYPGRAPENHVALTSFVGGSRQPELLERTDDELLSLVTGEVNEIMGGKGQPVFSRIIRWDRSIPQYTIGYHRVNAAIDRLEAEKPGLFVCSNFRGGIAVGDCVMNSERTAARISEFLQQRNLSFHKSISIGA